MSNWFKF